MSDVYLCDFIRTPIGRFGGTLAFVRPDDLGAVVQKALLARNPSLDLQAARLKLEQNTFDVIERNEAFASQRLACLRELGIADDDPRVNPNGGAIALGHPLGMSGVRITGTAAVELAKTKGRYAAATMCIGVGQGIAVAMASI